jgi:hypothetical protein
MTSYSSAQTAWTLEALDDYDFSSIAGVCDSGGGEGHLLSSLLAKYPRLSGTVLELASVIDDASRLHASKLGVGGRLGYVAGDMFEGGADAYFMKMSCTTGTTRNAARSCATSRARPSPVRGSSSSSTSSPRPTRRTSQSSSTCT